MESETQTIQLAYPIDTNGVKTDRLHLRRPTVGDLLNSTQNGRSDQEAEIWLLANLCSVCPDDLKALDLADYMRLQRALGKMQTSTHDSSGKP